MRKYAGRYTEEIEERRGRISLYFCNKESEDDYKDTSCDRSEKG